MVHIFSTTLWDETANPNISYKCINFIFHDFIALLILCLLPAGCAHASSPETPITKENWQNHPRIVAIRTIYDLTQKDIRNHKTKNTLRVFEYCEPYQDTFRSMYADGDGHIRSYANEGGSDDSMVTFEFYYDTSGKIRFAFIRGGAVNGTKIEHRIYFDENGKRLWEIQQLLEGPGYTFPHEPWPDYDIVYQPAEALTAENPCSELTK